MPKREEIAFPEPSDAINSFVGKRFVDERVDQQAFEGITFEFCTFEKVGLREATFERCVFRHCDFLDCYMVRARFESCNLTGSFFERCNFSWAEFPSSQLDYTRYSHCAPVLTQVSAQKPKDPQAATKFFRNLASEQKVLGNWQEVDRLIHQSYKESERHFYHVFTGANEYYKKRYHGVKRWSYALRWLMSLLNGAVWGYGVSWFYFLRSVALIWLIVLPVINMLFGRLEDRTAYFRSDGLDGDLIGYLALLYMKTTSWFFPFVSLPDSIENTLHLPFFLLALESIVGTIFLALFVSLLFRAASKGV